MYLQIVICFHYVLVILVPGSLPGQSDSLDGGNELGELTYAVSNAAYLASQGNGEDDRVEDSAVVADKEVATAARPRGRRRSALGHHFDTQKLVAVPRNALRQRDI